MTLILRMAEENSRQDASRWQRREISAMLAILIDMNIERQLDTSGVRKGVLFHRVGQLLREQNINRK